MRRALAMLSAALIPLAAGASEAMDSARADLEAARAGHSAALEKIAAARAGYSKRISEASARVSELEKRLAVVRGRTAGAESVSVRLGEKQGAYEGLRAEAALLAGALSEAGAGPRPFVSAEPSAFLSDLENLELASRRAAFSIEVLEKMLPDGGAERVLSEVSAGKGPIVRIDPSLGKVSRLRGRTVLGEISAGGVWMYPILAFGLAALLTAAAKAAVSMRVRRLPDGLVGAVVSRLESGDAAGAMAAAESAPAPYARLLSFFVKNRGVGRQLLEEAAYEQMLEVGDRLYSGLGFISVTAAVSPLLGLLGTVTGIIKTFSDLSVYGAGNPNLMSGGISEALITTEYGLVIAIPSFVVHALLSRRAKAVLSDMEKASAAFMGRAFKS